MPNSTFNPTTVRVHSRGTSRYGGSAAPGRVDPFTPPGRRWVQLSVAFGFAAFLLRVVSGYPFVDLDVFHQMALFREALKLGHLPQGDLWAFTPTLDRVVHHEWGTGAVLYGLVVAAGGEWWGLAALRIALVALICGLTWAAARRNGADGRVLVLFAPPAIALLVTGLSPVRAHLFTFAGIALLMLVAHADRMGRRRWVLPWLVVWGFWLNLHGGVTLGYVLFGVYVVERICEGLLDGQSLREVIRRNLHLFAVSVAMTLAFLVNPYGWAYLPYLWNALSLERSLIGEWVPIWNPAVQPALQLMYGFAVATAVYAVVKRRTLRLPGLGLLVISAWIAFQHQRMTPVLAVVWFAHVPAYLGATPLGAMLRRFGRRVEVPGAGVALVAGVVSLWMAAEARFWDLRLPGPADGHGWTAPVQAVQFLRATGFRGNLMTPFEEGAYVMWESYPAVRVGMDSRYEAAYPAGALEDNVALYDGAEGWADMLATTKTDAVLVPAGGPLDGLLSGAGGWSAAYRDPGHAVFYRGGRR